VEQREIGTDCPSFASGLKHVLRQDPDVILVGELRDLETIRTAIQAAETGHLVLATLHSSSAAGSIDRIIEVFPAGEQAQIRSHLADCLKAVVTQRLLPDTDGQGRVAAVEILIATRAIQTNIREGTIHLIPGMISTGRRTGMQTMEQAIKELVLNGRAMPEAAGTQLDELALTAAAVG
jgi:twitching motility protein PilT